MRRRRQHRLHVRFYDISMDRARKCHVKLVNGDRQAFPKTSKDNVDTTLKDAELLIEQLRFRTKPPGYTGCWSTDRVPHKPPSHLSCQGSRPNHAPKSMMREPQSEEHWGQPLESLSRRRVLEDVKPGDGDSKINSTNDE